MPGRHRGPLSSEEAAWDAVPGAERYGAFGHPDEDLAGGPDIGEWSAAEYPAYGYRDSAPDREHRDSSHDDASAPLTLPHRAESRPASGGRSASHRRPPARRISFRTSSLTALGVGLAVSVPMVLRMPTTALTLAPHGSGADGAGSSPQAADPGSDPAGGTDISPPEEPGHDAASGPVGAAPTGQATQGTPTPGARHATLPPPTTSASAAAPPTAFAPPPLPTSAAKAGPAPTTSATTSTPGTHTPATSTAPDQAAAFETQVIALTNAHRVSAGCPALHPDPRLRAAALAHSVDMQNRNYFAHDSPDGGTPWTRIAAQGYQNPSAENIAMGQRTPQQVVDAWMASPGHRANILNCSSMAIGVGVQFGANGPWWTQDFGYS